MSLADPERPDSYSIEFEQALAEVERSLLGLKERYAQIHRDRHRQLELQKRLPLVQQTRQQAHLRELDGELQKITEQLQELELALESSLLTDSNLKKLFWQGLRSGLLGEVFWQIVRFGGLGVALGWLLKSCTL